MVRQNHEDKLKRRYIEALLNAEFRYPLPTGHYIQPKQVSFVQGETGVAITISGKKSSVPKDLSFKNPLWENLIEKEFLKEKVVYFKTRMEQNKLLINIIYGEGTSMNRSILTHFMEDLHFRNSAFLKTFNKLYQPNAKMYKTIEDSFD